MIEVIASRSGFLVMYVQTNHILAIITPTTAILSSYTTAKVMGSACSKMSFHFLCEDVFLISCIAIHSVIDSTTNDIAKIINVRLLICIDSVCSRLMIP